MKNLVKNILVIMSMCLAVSISSCSTDNVFGDEEDWLIATPTDTTNTQTPETDEWHIDWNTDMRKRFGYRMDEYDFNWPSDIMIHLTNDKDNSSKDTIYTHQCPMTAVMTGPALIFADSLTLTKFNGITLLSEDATEWLPENCKEQEKLRTFLWEVNMTSYKDTITSTLVEARIMLEGKYVNFKAGSRPTPTRRSAEPKMGNDTTINGKLYSQEIVEVVINCELHKSYPVKEVSYLTKVLREKTVPVTVEEPSMPTPALKVRTIKNIPDYTFSPEFSGNQIVAWHKVLPVLATAADGKDYYYIWVDGSYVAKVAVGKENRVFNSAYFAEGSWRPATLEKDTDGGWKYVFVVNNEGKLKTVAENLALTSGLQNFRKTDNASQTPSVYTEKNYTEYSGRKYVEVIGFDIDMKPLIKTTIGECL